MDQFSIFRRGRQGQLDHIESSQSPVRYSTDFSDMWLPLFSRGLQQCTTIKRKSRSNWLILLKGAVILVSHHKLLQV